ncbi:hypothetical protein MPSEU_000037800 [Mayamaea pseudoterrestris]|nr:hypothetical protein MPSEU_000037800 [Mayamaea pseudoterrestris]
MPRFRDEWVVDRVLFDYMAGGSCACCGFSFLPNGTADLVHAVSDIDTDAANDEIQAMKHDPWPKELRDQIWADRVRLRQKAKLRMKTYQAFVNEQFDEFADWMKQQGNLNRMLQLPRSEIMSVIRGSLYDIHSAYAVVLDIVMEQVAFFSLTEYGPDGRSADELAFEQQLLQFDKRGGFVLKLLNDDGSSSEELLNMWLQRIKSLGGPKLLDRGPSKEDEAEEGFDADAGPSINTKTEQQASTGASFQSDRRIIRLIIARFWADLLMDKFAEAKRAKSIEV